MEDVFENIKKSLIPQPFCNLATTRLESRLYLLCFCSRCSKVIKVPSETGPLLEAENSLAIKIRFRLE